MTSKGALATVLLVGMAGTWWWVLSGPAFRPVSPTAARPLAATPPLQLPPAVALDRLATAAPAALAPPGRDPFRDARRGGGAGTASADVPARPPAAAEPLATPAPPRWPPLTLIGISTTRGVQGPERVAVFAGERGVLHGAVGELVAEVYRVEAIGDDTAEVTLVPESRRLVLRLR